MKKIIWFILVVILVLPLGASAAPASYQEGYLVIGTCTTDLLKATEEYDARRSQESTDFHIRKTRNWLNLTFGYYALVYAVCPTLEAADLAANQVRARGINVYVKHSGRGVGEAGCPSGYFVIGLCSPNLRDAQREFSQSDHQRLPDTYIAHSNEYADLSPEYYCIFYACFKSVDAANRYADYLQRIGIDVYVKHGIWKG